MAHFQIPQLLHFATDCTHQEGESLAKARERETDVDGDGVETVVW